MKIDGFAILAVNEKGDKAVVKDRKSHDERLEDRVQWDDMDIEEFLLPSGVADCLVMVFFSYRSFPDGPWEAPHSEYSEELNIEHYVVMQKDYKEFERLQISYLVTSDGYEDYPRELDDTDADWINGIIEDWELLHDEDFVVHEKYAEGMHKAEGHRIDRIIPSRRSERE